MAGEQRTFLFVLGGHAVGEEHLDVILVETDVLQHTVELEHVLQAGVVAEVPVPSS